MAKIAIVNRKTHPVMSFYASKRKFAVKMGARMQNARQGEPDGRSFQGRAKRPVAGG
ncbi:aconitate hydratase [Sulfitobacter sp. NAS-14.1]|nr:aconitate hydratase [Sulfitobacter sp. NAS-14.1]